mmetsp:Transcript_3524/g.8123  ORF Transcript_3524/g.8123 Transcript_3524/m.8123 type:complete len:256 (+) Transcript_3524:536-1303(+)
MLHHARDSHAVLALHAARGGQGDVWVEQRHVILGCSARTVDGPAQDGVRMAPEESGSAADRRWMAQPCCATPPGFPRDARLLPPHPWEAPGLGQVDHSPGVLGAPRACRVDGDGGASEVCGERPPPGVCRVWCYGVRRLGGSRRDGDGSRAPYGSSCHPPVRLGGVRRRPPPHAAGSEQEEGLRGHHGVGAKGGARRGRAARKRGPCRQERTYLVPFLELRTRGAYGSLSLHRCRGQDGGPERVLPVCGGAAVLV